MMAAQRHRWLARGHTHIDKKSRSHDEKLSLQTSWSQDIKKWCLFDGIIIYVTCKNVYNFENVFVCYWIKCL